MELEVRHCLKNIEKLVSNSPDLSNKISNIRELYLQTSQIGLEWVRVTLEEDWEKEPLIARDFFDHRSELTKAIFSIREAGMHKFSNSMIQISNQTKSVWSMTTLVFAIGFILFVAVTIQLYRSITLPIHRLLEVIKDIRKQKNNFSKRVSISSFDEIGQLGTSFNRLLDDLEFSQKKINDYTEKLENQVQERTDQLREEKDALKESERYLKIIWESLMAGIIVIDTESHTIEDANPYALKLMDRSLAEVKGQLCHKIMCPAELGKCPITDLGQQIDGSERLLIGQKGEKIPVLKAVVPFEKKDHKFLIESFVDIRDLKKTQNRLESAKVEAENANRAKSEFLANMSHELRTPLNHIIGFTEIVLDQKVGNLTSMQAEFLSDVHASSKHLLTLINDILDLSKVEAGKLELKPSNVSLKTLLEHSLIMVKEKASKEDIKLSIHTDKIPESIVADERKLKQIMYNLLSNAVKFTGGGGSVSVSAKRCSWDATNQKQDAESANGYVEIAVSDTGIGIAPGNLERIFNPFEQADNSSSRAYQGTGLGLSLTKSLVELHGGKIWAECEKPFSGSTFRFIIPTIPS
jgi:PAS domain S-box-containing protein